eukprot:Rhum_TRINITY_DN24894_c0_g1::Rhum_TRINITY_DN24894_c0_g1_i1::g.180422::m.180422/K11841/USP10, UBP3; ubiquitin carboxyl-terminal hydrolase 10
MAGGWVTVGKQGKQKGGHAKEETERAAAETSKKILLQKQQKATKQSQGAKQQKPPAAASPPRQEGAAAAPSASEYVFKLSAKPTGYCLKGLVNRGNTCYQNALVQGLLSTPAFLNMAKGLPAPGKDMEAFPVMRALRKIVYDCRPGASSSGDAIELLHAIVSQKQYAKSITLGRQQDACEYLVLLLDALSAEMKQLAPQAKAPKQEKEDGWQTVDPSGKTRGVEHHTGTEADGCAVQQIFGGRMSSRLARRGEKPSVTLQPFTVLPLDVTSDAHTSIENFLLSHTAPQTVELANGSSATKQESFAVLPQALCVCLKLWFDPSTKSRIAQKMQLDELLTIHGSSVTSRKKHEYALTAVVCHKGAEMTSGHYTAVVRKNGQWFHVDDTEVRKLPAYSSQSADPYILFYSLKA